MIGFLNNFKSPFKKLLFFSGFALLNFQVFYSYAESLSNYNVDNIEDIIQGKTFYSPKYILGPGDKLEIIFLDETNFSGIYKIFNDGSIYLPLLGGIKVADLTTEKATQKIKNIYANELLRPDLYIKLIEMRPIKVSLIGEIERPGIYTFKSDIKNKESANSLPTLIDALKLAGGVSTSANLKEVSLIRRFSGDESEFIQTNLNLLDLLLKGNLTQNPYLFDGDVIKLKKAKEMTPNLIKVAKSNFSPIDIQVTVIGEVENPGIIELRTGSNLMQAIMQAGGPIHWNANRSNVQLMRLNKNGSTFLKKYKINISKEISETNNPILKNGDIIKLNKTRFANLSDGIEKTTKPISGIVNAYTLFKILE